MWWVEAGFSPDDFWHQTPRSYRLIMQGVRKRLEAEGRERTRQAWETGAFSAAAQSKGGLKPLRHYLPTPTKQQTPREMLAAMREFQARGARMKITRIKRRPT